MNPSTNYPGLDWNSDWFSGLTSRRDGANLSGSGLGSQFSDQVKQATGQFVRGSGLFGVGLLGFWAYGIPRRARSIGTELRVESVVRKRKAEALCQMGKTLNFFLGRRAILVLGYYLENALVLGLTTNNPIMGGSMKKVFLIFALLGATSTSMAGTSPLQFSYPKNIEKLLIKWPQMAHQALASSLVKGQLVKIDQIVVSFREDQVDQWTDCYLTATASTNDPAVTFTVKEEYDESSCDDVSADFLKSNFNN